MYSGDLTSLPSRSRLYVRHASTSAPLLLVAFFEFLPTLFFILECMSTLCGAGNEVGAATGAVLALGLTFFKVAYHMFMLT